MKIAYGYDTKPDGKDELIGIVEEAMEQFGVLQKPGEFLVDLVPSLKYVPSWFPGAGFQRKARYYRETLQNMIDVPFNMVQRQLVRPTLSPYPL